MLTPLFIRAIHITRKGSVVYIVPDAAFTKMFFFVTQQRAKEVRVFVPGRPFQPIVM
jgi:hypothetical protein